MPILICPACNSGMTEINRNGVSIDVCTNAQCRGVWFDRGELEKLLSIVRADFNDGSDEPQPMAQQQRPASPPPPPQQHQQPHYQQQPPYQQPHYGHKKYDDDDDYKYGRYKKKSGLKTFMDIFD